MAHMEQREFFKRVRFRFPQKFCGVRILDVGSWDVNGNLRYMIGEGSSYLGVDVSYGPNVDLVLPGHEVRDNVGFGAVLSAECLEHDQHWPDTLLNMWKLLVPGGIMAISCATTGRLEHGTRRSEPNCAPALQSLGTEWADYYRNLTQGDLLSVFNPIDSYFATFEFSTQDRTHDLYFWGIKPAG